MRPRNRSAGPCGTGPGWTPGRTRKTCIFTVLKFEVGATTTALATWKGCHRKKQRMWPSGLEVPGATPCVPAKDYTWFMPTHRAWVWNSIDRKCIEKAFTGGVLLKKPLLEKFYWRNFMEEFYSISFPKLAIVFTENLSNKPLLVDFYWRTLYWRSFTEEILLEKFYWSYTVGNVLCWSSEAGSSTCSACGSSRSTEGTSSGSRGEGSACGGSSTGGSGSGSSGGGGDGSARGGSSASGSGSGGDGGAAGGGCGAGGGSHAHGSTGCAKDAFCICFCDSSCL